MTDKTTGILDTSNRTSLVNQQVLDGTLRYSTEKSGSGFCMVHHHVADGMETTVNISGKHVAVVTDGSPILTTQVKIGHNAQVHGRNTSVYLLGHPAQCHGVRDYIVSVLALLKCATSITEAVLIIVVRSVNGFCLGVGIGELGCGSSVAVVSTRLINHCRTCTGRHRVCTNQLEPCGCLIVGIQQISDFTAGQLFLSYSRSFHGIGTAHTDNRGSFQIEVACHSLLLGTGVAMTQNGSNLTTGSALYGTDTQVAMQALEITVVHVSENTTTVVTCVHNDNLSREQTVCNLTYISITGNTTVRVALFMDDGQCTAVCTSVNPHITRRTNQTTAMATVLHIYVHTAMYVLDDRTTVGITDSSRCTVHGIKGSGDAEVLQGCTHNLTEESLIVTSCGVIEVCNAVALTVKCSSEQGDTGPFHTRQVNVCCQHSLCLGLTFIYQSCKVHQILCGANLIASVHFIQCPCIGTSHQEESCECPTK